MRRNFSRVASTYDDVIAFELTWLALDALWAVLAFVCLSANLTRWFPERAMCLGMKESLIGRG